MKPSPQYLFPNEMGIFQIYQNPHQPRVGSSQCGDSAFTLGAAWTSVGASSRSSVPDSVALIRRITLTTEQHMNLIKVDEKQAVQQKTGEQKDPQIKIKATGPATMCG